MVLFNLVAGSHINLTHLSDLHHIENYVDWKIAANTWVFVEIVYKQNLSIGWLMGIRDSCCTIAVKEKEASKNDQWQEKKTACADVLRVKRDFNWVAERSGNTLICKRLGSITG